MFRSVLQMCLTLVFDRANNVANSNGLLVFDKDKVILN